MARARPGENPADLRRSLDDAGRAEHALPRLPGRTHAPESGLEHPVTAKADAKKRAKPQAAKRAPSPRARADQPKGDSEAASPEEGNDEDSESEDHEPEALGDEREVFDTEAEIVESEDADLDERREPSDERDPSAEIEYAGERERERERDDDPDERGLARFDALQAYMREVQRHPLLSADEEHKLAVQYQKNQDRDVAARLVTANLRLVVKIAYEYRRAYRNMMDLVQEGNMGLMQAVKKYDTYRGVKLSSYAAWWIRAYMLRYILANWRMVKLGTTQAQRKLFFNLSKEKARLSAMGIEPTNAEIARRLDVAESEVEEMDKRMSKGDASLDLPVSENDGRQIARVELLPSLETTPDLATESAELGGLLRQHLAEFRATLSDKDLIIFDQRLVADEPRTLQDLGEEFGVSRERVRQLEARITGRLRTFLGQHLGDAVEIAG